MLLGCEEVCGLKKMTEGGITGHLIGYALPMIFGNIFQLTYNAVDSDRKSVV